ncbi:MAG: hypothetical protein PHX51_03620 [Clostridia bacterium]|nr:hypothetical protein [Clostridia bacterium]
MGKKTNSYIKGDAPAATAQPKNILIQKLIVLVVLLLLLAFFLVATIKYINFEATTHSEVSNTTTTVQKSANKIVNGGFDYSIDYDQLTYPRMAHYWTISQDDNDKILSGVVGTTEEEWAKAGTNINGVLTSKEAGYTVSNPYTPSTDLSLTEEEREEAAKLLGEDKDLNEDTDTSRVFMVSSYKESYARFTSSSFSVASESFYKISFWVKTVGVQSGNGLSVVLKTTSSASDSSDDLVDGLSFKSIETGGAWKLYQYYIRGNESSSKTMYFEFGLGLNNLILATGTAFIDNIVCSEVTAGDYGSALREKDTTPQTKVYSYYSIKDDTENIANLYTTAQVDELKALSENPDFIYSGNSKVEDWISVISVDDYLNSEAATYKNTIYFPFISDETGTVDDLLIYKITNTAGTSGVGGIILSKLIEDGTQSDFTVNKYSYNDYYVVSMYVRMVGMNPNTGANIYLNDASGKYSSSFTSITTPSDISEDKMNGWVKYSFYVMPSQTEDVTLWLEAYVGSRAQASDSNLNQKGILYITELEVNKITKKDYSDSTSGTYIKKLQLSSTLGTSTLTNGLFDDYASNELLGSYPYAPSGWTGMFGTGINYSFVDDDGNLIVDDQGDVVYPVNFGVLNSTEVDKNLALGITAADFISDGYNNMLWMTNNVETSFGLKSSTVSLTASTYYRFSIVAKELDGALNIYISGDINLHLNAAEATANADRVLKRTSVDLGNGFTEYVFYLATGEVARTVTIEIWNGLKDGTGTTTGSILVDMADYTTLEKAAFQEEVEKLGYVFPEETEDKKEEEEETVVPDPILFNGTSEGANFDNAIFYDFSLSDLADERLDDNEEEEEEEEEEESNSSGKTSSLGWEVIGTICLVGALVIVIIVVIVRKRKQAHKLNAWKKDEKRLGK